MTATTVLQFPSNYILMDSDEMEYLEGGGIGKHWYNKTKNVGLFLDVAIACISGGASIYNVVSFRKFIKSNRKKLVKTIQKELLKRIGTASAAAIGSAIDIVFTVAGGSAGSLIAWGLDRFDGKRNDGYIFA